MSAALRPRRVIGTALALGAAWAIWNASASIADFLKWPDLLPLVRLCAVAVGVTALEFIFNGLRPLLQEPSASATEGTRE